MTNELSTILRDSKSIDGPTTRYILNTKKIIQSELLKKERIGENDDKTPNKVILLVGETGTGKTTLINAMVNYIMGVRWEHRMWLEISECLDEKSQTTAVTVYEVFARDSPFCLTIIDTPGFGNTQGREKDKRIAEALEQLFTSEDGIHEIDVICLVLKASESRLHERQLYIQDEILSLFGKNLEENILILLTNSHANVPKRLLHFIKASKIPCAKEKDGHPVYFTFDNCQSECYDEEDRESYKSSWDHGIENFKQFFDYLNVINPGHLNMTADLLSARKQLDENVDKLKNKPIALETLKRKIEDAKQNLGELEAYRITMNNFEYEVEEFFEEKVHMESSWWHLATCCTVCEENCHPGCWCFTDLSWCSVMSKGNCTVCTGKCHYTKHVKDDKIYVIVSRKVTKTEENMKEKYEKDVGEEQGLINKLQTNIKKIEEEMIELLEKCYQCLEKLMETSLKSTSRSSFRHLDFMIEKVKETGKQERVRKLEELQIKAQEENMGLMRRFL
ncbi:uncharacterized protein LOC130546762 isoform X2 [Triplophysa rosa]|nr:uncharacterized protein LOC130546762 isoform X2 [Triplophysa rosa]XP_057178160.1 uncharacterized protein LOC130546762 isoform X2 [Triplophysa rosa]XP_057178161.1 uncharacterized protein LOC130546762 isoform X2 [Triplophysa rosa]